jgi:hypothetical protein
MTPICLGKTLLKEANPEEINSGVTPMNDCIGKTLLYIIRKFWGHWGHWGHWGQFYSPVSE